MWFFSPQIAVTYNARLRRVRIRFPLSECLKSRLAPAEPCLKAREKLEEERELGNIEYFEVFEKKFAALWQHIRRGYDSFPPNHWVSFTLAQGARAYSEIELQRSKDTSASSLALLSCKLSDRKAATIYFNAFVFHIMRQLRHMGIEQRPDAAQLRFVYLLMRAGQPLSQCVLRAQPSLEDSPESPYSVQIEPQYGYASLHILDPSVLLSSRHSEGLLAKVRHSLRSQGHNLQAFHFLDEHTELKLESLRHKVQSLGFALPYSLLIAYPASYKLDAGVMHAEKQQAEGQKASALPRWKLRLGAAPGERSSLYLDIAVSADGLRATLRDVQREQIKALGDKLTLDWLEHECHEQGLVCGYEPYLEELVALLRAGQAVIGKTIAQGTAGVAGVDAFLYEHWKIGPISSSDGPLRSRQNRRLARQGDVLAEVRTRDGQVGRTVWGSEHHALGSAVQLGLTVGEGVAIQKGGCFVALKDGLIESGAGVLAVKDVYVHQGSINLSSGDLKMQGEVLIQGDIEAGSTVQIKGQLVVAGMIGNAHVQVEGDLEAQGGIITTSEGWVRVSGNCQAAFIENSRLHVDGDLDIKTLLLNSCVVCGQKLTVHDSSKGLISGGEVSSWESITVQQMGLAEGQRTVCRVGSHPADEKRQQRLLHRLAWVQKVLSSEPSEERKEKAERIMKKLKTRIDQESRKQRWNPSASLRVAGLMQPPIQIEAGGKPVPIDQAYRSVLITASPMQGSHMHDLEELEAILKREAS